MTAPDITVGTTRRPVDGHLLRESPAQRPSSLSARPLKQHQVFLLGSVVVASAIDAKEERESGGPSLRAVSVRGEIRWPSAGTSLVRPRGDSVAVYGESGVAAVTPGPVRHRPATVSCPRASTARATATARSRPSPTRRMMTTSHRSDDRPLDLRPPSPLSRAPVLARTRSHAAGGQVVPSSGGRHRASRVVTRSERRLARGQAERCIEPLRSQNLWRPGIQHATRSVRLFRQEILADGNFYGGGASSG